GGVGPLPQPEEDGPGGGAEYPDPARRDRPAELEPALRPRRWPGLAGHGPCPYGRAAIDWRKPSFTRSPIRLQSTPAAGSTVFCMRPRFTHHSLVSFTVSIMPPCLVP